MKLAKIIACALILCPLTKVNAQISLAQLGNDIYQNNSFNPSFFPKGKWFIGVPAISHIGINLNNRISYFDIIEESENGPAKLIYDNLLSRLNRENALQLHLKVGGFHVGFRKNQAAISLFSNDRIDSDFLFPRKLIDIMLNGADDYIGKSIEINGLGLKARYYRETGFSYSYFDKKRKFSVGYRIKLLNGFFNVSTLSSFNASMKTSLTNPTVDFSLKDAVVNTSGFSNFSKSNFRPKYLFFNENRGVALDLGGSYPINDRIEVSVSINDIGYINWKENAKNYRVVDTSFSYGGLDLRNVSNITKSLEDSLGSRFKRKTTDDAYFEWNPLVVNLTGKYKITRNDEISSAISSRILFGKMKMTYSVGAKHRFGKFLAVNVSIVKLPHQLMNLGVSAVIDAGSFQFYLGSDKPFALDYKKLRSANVSLGMNLILGRGVKSGKSDAPSKFRFLGGDHVKVKDKESIYLIIKKQSRKRALFDPDKKDESKLRKIKG